MTGDDADPEDEYIYPPPSGYVFTTIFLAILTGINASDSLYFINSGHLSKLAFILE